MDENFNKLRPCPNNGTAGYFWPLLFLFLLAFLIWTEDGSQNATHKCHNSAQPIYDSDTDVIIINKIIKSLRTNHQLVHWRRSLIAAFLLTIIFLFLWAIMNEGQGFACGFYVFIIALFIFFAVYFSQVYIQNTWWQNRDKKLEYHLRKLKDMY